MRGCGGGEWGWGCWTMAHSRCFCRSGFLRRKNGKTMLGWVVMSPDWTAYPVKPNNEFWFLDLGDQSEKWVSSQIREASFRNVIYQLRKKEGRRKGKLHGTMSVPLGLVRALHSLSKQYQNYWIGYCRKTGRIVTEYVSLTKSIYKKGFKQP